MYMANLGELSMHAYQSISMYMMYLLFMNSVGVYVWLIATNSGYSSPIYIYLKSDSGCRYMLDSYLGW